MAGEAGHSPLGDTMSTDMRGIVQTSLFSLVPGVAVNVGPDSQYRVLSQIFPWVEAAAIVNRYRSEKVDIENGRILNLRAHIGALIAQTMNGWTDRQTEEMVRYHAGVRLLCGLEGTTTTMDRTRIEAFRNCVGKTCAEELNQMVLRSAQGAGFTGIEICAADTTVQESPIAYPTEVGHMKNIAEKILGFGKTLGLKSVAGLGKLKDKAQGLFTSIRLFTRGKTEQALEKKKKLSKKMNSRVQKMVQLAKADLESKRGTLAAQAREQLELYGHMLEQIKIWMKTGFHPKDKIISLWDTTARAISKGKSGKSVEFGRRWIITRLMGGYVTGAPCQKIGADADTQIADEVLMNFMDTFGEVPENFIYDRGADSKKNEIFLSEVGVENICIFPKGRRKMDVPPEVLEMARRERSLNEASIANLKSKKYNFTKPRARSQHACDHKGFSAMLGFNLNLMLRDLGAAMEIRAEIT
jgi:hypothetical protein